MKQEKTRLEWSGIEWKGMVCSVQCSGKDGTGWDRMGCHCCLHLMYLCLYQHAAKSFSLGRNVEGWWSTLLMFLLQERNLLRSHSLIPPWEGKLIFMVIWERGRNLKIYLYCVFISQFSWMVVIMLGTNSIFLFFIFTSMQVKPTDSAQIHFLLYCECLCSPKLCMLEPTH